MAEHPPAAAHAVRADLVSRVLVSAGTQSWLASMIIHMVLLIALALLLGTIEVVRSIRGPQFEATAVVDEPPPVLDRFEPGEAPLETTIIDLTLPSLPDNDTGLEDLTGKIQAPVIQLPGKPNDDLGISGLGGILTREGLGRTRDSSGPAGGRGREPGLAGNLSVFQKRGTLKGTGGTPQSERAVAAALNWLARHQNADGSWSLDHRARCRSGSCSGPGQTDADQAATALALLPFLAAGQTHESDGPYRKTVSTGLTYLIKNQKATGDLSGGSHQMYSHGLCTIALCELYGMTQDSRVGIAAQSAINFIESGQNNQGGWRYTHGSDSSDTSVFGWQVMALKSGQMAGLKVNPAALDGCRAYLKQVSSGKYGHQFSYTPGATSTPTMTSVGLLGSQYLGARKDDPVVVGGIEYLLDHPPRADHRNTYYWYYATQVMHNVPSPEWDRWNRQMRRVLIETQEKTGCAAGSWDSVKPHEDPWGNAGGRLMITSLSTLTLEVYYRYLPLYQMDEGAQ